MADDSFEWRCPGCELLSIGSAAYAGHRVGCERYQAWLARLRREGEIRIRLRRLQAGDWPRVEEGPPPTD